MAIDTASLARLEDRLFRIEARGEIQDLVARYAHGADRKNDPAIMGTLFHDDATWSAEGFSTFTGREAIAEGLSAIARKDVLWSVHYMISPYVELAEDGQCAACHWYLWELATMATANGSEDSWLGGWYEATATRKDSLWKFSSVNLDLRIQGLASPAWHMKKSFDQ